MAVYGTMVLTDQGLALYAKAQTGLQLNFTRMQIGSGQLSGQDPMTLTALIDPISNFAINSITSSGNTSFARGIFENSSLTLSTYSCELGLFATDPDAGEILYAYANAGAQGDTIPPLSAGPYSKQFQINAAIGNATDVTATIPTGTYIPTTDKGVAGGVAPLNGNSEVPLVNIPRITGAKIADDNVTDAKIGNRTIDDTIVAAAGADTPTRLWSKLANMIKAITGKANWYTPPVTTIEGLNTNKLNKAGDAMTGALSVPSLSVGNAIKSYTMEKKLYTTFASASNQKVDICLTPNGNNFLVLDVSIQAFYAGLNGTGIVTKRFYIGASPTGGFHHYSSRCIEAGGLTPTLFAIGEVVWDSSTGLFRIKLISRSTATNPIVITLKSMNIDSASEFIGDAYLSAIYTTDTTAYPVPVVDLHSGTTLSGNGIWHTGILRDSSGVLQFYTGGVWKAVGGMKNSQRGKTTCTMGTTTNITISSVVISKTMVNLLSIIGTTSSQFHLRLTSPTNLAIEAPLGSGTTDISWEVLEFN